MREEWRPLVGYEGLYEVSNRGNMKSLNYRRTGKEGILKAVKDKDGYLRVQLWKDGKRKMYAVHRLVAQAFLPNPNNLPIINHKDENKQNNKVENLEWCNISYNNIYNGRAKKVAEKLSKPVIAIDKINGLILEFPSAHEASRQTGIAQSHINACCKGKRKSCGGFYWMYADADAE